MRGRPFRRARRATLGCALATSLLLCVCPIARGQEGRTPAGPDLALSDPLLIGSGVSLVLDNADTLTGSLVRVEGGMATIEHPILGEISVPTTRIVRVRRAEVTAKERPEAVPGAEPAPAPVPGSPPEERPADLPPPPAPKPAAVWKTRLELGLDGAKGNSDRLNFRGGLRVDRDTPDTSFRFNSRYVINTVGGDRTGNRFTANARNDWRLPNKRYTFFVQSGAEADEYREFDLRWTGGTGFSALLIDDPRTRLNTSLGAGFAREFGSSNKGYNPELITALEFTHKLTDMQTLTFTAELYPDLEHLGEFRSVFRPTWDIRLDATRDLTLRLGLEHRYESMTTRAEHWDIDYFATLVLSF